MSTKYKNFVKGIAIIPKDSSETANNLMGELEVLSDESGKLNYHNGTSSSHIVTEIHASQGVDRLQNKDLDDDTTAIVDSSDITKKILFNAAGSTATSTTITSSQTTNRILTLPNATDTLIGKNTTDTLTNKSLVDNSTAIVDNSDNTKQILFNAEGSTGTSTTITSSQTTNRTLTLPNATDTLVGKATTDTLTNKTFDTAGTGNVFRINGTGITAVTGSDEVVLKTSPTLTTPQIAAINVGGTYTLTLPTSAPSGGSQLYYNGTNYIWNPIPAALGTKYTYIVGSAADVTSGKANYSYLQTAVNALTSGGSILLLSSYTRAEDIEIPYNNILIEGQNNLSIIDGKLDFKTNTLNCSVSNLRINGNITFNATSKYNFLTNVWVESTADITDNGTANYMMVIQE